MYALILAGGSGTRLWPFSRSGMPKQFLALGSTRTMLQQTADRVLPLIPAQNIYVATGAAYATIVAEQLPEVPVENILIEPIGRGTAPCIGHAALQIRRRDPDAVMAVLSADHAIKRGDAFCDALAAAGTIAADGLLVTLGIRMWEPSTGYGYIRRGKLLAPIDGHEVFQVAAFVEKPNRERAEEYFAAGGYDWNAGIFIWRASVVADELARHQPALFAQLNEIDHAPAGPEGDETMLRVWPHMQTIAIDVAVMEVTDRAVVIPVEIGWSDVGDWSALADVLPQDVHGNSTVGSTTSLDTARSLLFSVGGRTLATIGLEDMIVVDTGTVVLVCPRARAQDVKAMVAQVRAQGFEGLL